MRQERDSRLRKRDRKDREEEKETDPESGNRDIGAGRKRERRWGR